MHQVEDMIGTSPAMRAVVDVVRKVAKTDLPVLITGETGTGKELTAHAIHAHSLRQQGVFVPINCGAIPEPLVESELFGYERGAFTGAVQRKPGRVEAAAGGTLFLDEVGDLLPCVQVKLLRFLQNGTFERVGGQAMLHVDTRVIGATHVDLKTAMEQNRFREDLYYRLGVLHIHLPPLRERGEDTLLLAMRFLTRAAGLHGKAIRGYTSDALAALRAYPWPGNVRELSNRVRRAVVLAEGMEITARDLDLPREATHDEGDALASLKAAQRRLEVELIVKGIRLHQGNLTRVARDLDMSRTTLYRKLREYNLQCLVPPSHPTSAVTIGILN